MNGKDLFAKKPIEQPKEDSKQEARHFTPEQITGMQRDKVLRYFGSVWMKKYRLNFIQPKSSDKDAFLSVFKPLSEAIKQGYTVEQLCKGIDAYLADDFEGYTQSSHPIRLFAKHIMKFVAKAEQVNRQKPAINQPPQVDTDTIRKVNEQYGIVRRGDGWEAEDGSFFPDLNKAIEAYNKKHKKVPNENKSI